ncbi:MAG: DUF4350 domain-containing protein [Cyanobacteria bacterium P01_D01_bin.105]
MTVTKLNRRYLTIAVLGLLLLIGLAIAPTYNRIQSGSTWSKAPDGYGAWYEYMQQQGAPIQRWQRSLDELTAQTSDPKTANQPATLIRIVPPAIGTGSFPYELNDWVKQGNHVIVLSQQRPVTDAPFDSEISSPHGLVTVQTRRRANQDDAFTLNFTPVLADDYGAVVWQETTDGKISSGSVSSDNLEAGQFIQAATPFLSANAYLASPGNFTLLAKLAQQGSGPIFVDEYLHGYKDKDVVVEEVAGTWFGYLAKTPLIVTALQSVVVLVVVLVAQNRRPGLARSLQRSQENNSEAYITALAGVLHKANSQDFLIETLAKAEQKALQRSLGLGDAPVSLSTLKTAWQQTTGQSPAELNILKAKPQGDTAIQQWLKRIQQLHIQASQRS